MKVKLKIFLNWSARILIIFYSAFLSLFALDVFGEGYSFWETLVALFMHLIPTFVLMLALVVAWKKRLVGGIIFLLLGLAFTFFFATYEHLTGFLFLSLPLGLAGVLFLLAR